ncbi:hypothetical protein [Acidovorax sp. NCPPB 4044]|uniref:hypothetical protein n=1 Tax=Acidovorax sp. NCPPB 4044 TaxID=2940490 RepID=UPI0023037F62|nr:hypothetical protein [Acidovorax sp. NCPPB 4044]MDA8521897.1 hypothetical protein [Acidovorax sp. NCPPB 4044]
MPLDIGFLLPDGRYDLRLQFDGDGCYWFLHPWFTRVQRTTGSYVDLYGDADFHEANGLDALIGAMAEARAAAARQPTEWRVHTGTQLVPVRQELYATVERVEILRSIERFQALLEEAKVSRKTLAFRGD